MKKNRIFNAVILAIIPVVLIAFGYLYNESVRATLSDAASQAKEILQEYNDEITARLIKEESADRWNEILQEYDEIIVSIEDSKNNEIAASKNNSWTALDVKVQTPFEFEGEAYLISSSVYLLENYVADVKVTVKFIAVEFMIVMSVFAFLIILLYRMILMPFRKLYKAIEEYDKTGTLEKINIRGYAGHVYRRFVSMTQNIEANQRNQRRIIASISHDIKTPLTSIMGYAERLQKDNISPERKKHYLETVYGKSLEIQELVTEFDEYLSADHRQPISMKKYSTDMIALYVTEAYTTDLEDMGITLRVNNYAGRSYVALDSQKIKRVLGNIISNSIKHFREGRKIIRVDIYSDRDKVYFNIHDNGHGVPAEKQEIIFEPLYTSDEGRKVAGLGLSICKEIIEAHSGVIYAGTSDLGGAVIRIELDRVKNITD